MDENFQKLYGALVNAKLLDVSFDAFSQYMESDGYQQKVFQAVTDKGLFNQSFDQFKSAYAPTPVKVEEALPEDKGWFADMATAISGGARAGSSVGEAFDVYRQGRSISDEDLGNFIEAANAMAEGEETNEAASWRKDTEKHGGGFLGGFMGLVENPGYAPQFIASSLSTMVSSLVDSGEVAAATGTGAAGGAAVGSGIGAVAASIGGPIGTALGYLGGGASGAIGGGMAGLVGAMETGLTLTDLLRDELGEKEFNQENIRALLNDKDVMERVKSRSLARGLTIGAVEGLTFGLSRGVGGKILAKGVTGLSKAGLKTGAKVAAATTAVEMAGGGGGEALGMLAAGQELVGEEIFLEMIGEGKGIINTSDIVKSALTKSSYKLNKEETTAEKIKEIIDSPNTSKADLAEMNIEVTGDKAFDNFVKTKQNDAYLDVGIDSRIGDQKDRDQLVEWEKQRAKAKADTEKTGIFAVPNADVKLEDIESKIADLIGQYEGVDVTDTGVVAREKTKKVVAEKQFKANLEFAKKHSGLYGLEVDDTMDKTQIEKYLSDNNLDASGINSDGFIHKGKIIINTKVAMETGAVNVGNHELLHGILRKAMKEDPGKFKNIKADLQEQFGSQWSVVEDRVNAKDKDGKRLYSDEYMEANPDEWITLTSDAIQNDEITFNENVFTKLGDMFTPILRKFGFKKIKFDTGKDVYNFLREYNKSIHKGSLSGGITEATAGVVETAGMKASRSKAVTAVNEIEQEIKDKILAQEKKYTKAEFQGSRGFDNIFNSLQPNGAISNYVKSLGMSPEKTQKTIDAVTDRLVNYDPQAERKTASGEPITIGEFMMANVGYGKLVAAKELAVEGEIAKKTTSIDTEEAKQIADTPTETKTTLKKQDKARVLQDLNDVELENMGQIDATIIAEIEALIEKNPTNLEQQVERLIEKAFTKMVLNDMGKISKEKGDVVVSEEYKAWHALSYDSIINSLSDDVIKNNYKTLFDIKKIGREKDKKVNPITGVVTYPGKGIFEIKTNKAKWTKYFTQGGYTTLLARRKSLAQLIAKAKAKKAINNYIEQNSKDVNKVINAKLQNFEQSLDNQANQIGSFDSVKFSKSKTFVNEIIKSTDKLYATGRFADRGRALEQAINEFLRKQKIPGLKILIEVATEEDGMADLYLAIERGGKVVEEFGVEIKLGTKDVRLTSNRISQYTISSGEVILTEKNPFKSKDKEVVNREKIIKSARKEIKAYYDDINATIEQYNNGETITVDQGTKKTPLTVEYTRGKNKKFPLVKTSKDPIPFFAHQSALNKGLASDVRNKSLIQVDLGALVEIAYSMKKWPSSYIEFLGNFYALGVDRVFNGDVPVLAGIADVYVEMGSSGRGANKALAREYGTPVVKVAPRIMPSPKKFTSKAKGSIVDGDYMTGLMKKNHPNIDSIKETVGDTKTLNNAVNFSRSANNPTKGITILDFDDTLATSKSLVRYTAPVGVETYATELESMSDKELLKLADAMKDPEYFRPVRTVATEFRMESANRNDLIKAIKKQLATNYGKPKALREMTEAQVVKIAKLMKDPEYLRPVQNKLNEFNVESADLNDLIKAIEVQRTKKYSKGVNKILDIVIKTEGTLNAEQFANTYQDLQDKGYTFDFSDFDKVVKGKVAPLFQKALKLQKKFGPENMFVLTARNPQAAKAIFDFLKANGLNIPMKNITGLGNSTAEAKALWIADKVGEGFNDFYFADDALQNVQAVKNMLDQFDVKSKVQQAKVKFSKSMNTEFNNILEDVTGIESDKRFAATKARKRGADKGKFRFFIPPSHEDFVGLLYNFMGEGRKGDAHRNFFEQALVRPLNRANREYDTARQSIANDYKALNKKFPDVKNKLTKKTPDGDFTNQDAIRIYLWDKHGHKIPGLSEIDQAALVELVKSDPEMQAYAETVNVISKQEAYVNPTEGWESGDIRVDLDDATGRVGRAEFFAEFNENASVVFSEENLNKIEAGFGNGVREALEDMLYRIKTGRNRPSGQNKIVNRFMNYLNGSVGTVMFFNMRSALLQQMSIVNYINFADNNVFAAAKAFANQKQYWKDFSFIFNSDMLKQRRGGIQTDINGAELAESLRNSKNPTRKLVSKLLELGFLPTQIGDNIAIATGGAAYYRNRINTYLKQGLSQKEAEAKAFTDFQDITQSTQQSARPDMVSQQQASVLGKVILNFQNVTSQFNRLGKKAFLDIKNRRITKPNTTQTQSDISNAARITYYFAVQNAIFYTLQTALFAMLFDDDEEDDNKLFLKKKERLINGSIDSVLRGSGVLGAVIATLKNVAIAFARQRDVKYNPDESAVLMEALNLSPVVGIKARKITNAEKTLNYNKKVIDEMETFDIDNPQWSAVTNYVETATNVPLNRLYNKTQNVRQALNNDHSTWERTLMFLGWSQYNLNLENKKMEDIKESVKKKKTSKTEKEKALPRKERQTEKQSNKESQFEKDQKKEKKEGKKNITCSAVTSDGGRCKGKPVKGGKCTIHEKVEMHSSGKSIQCRKKKSDGNRCGMITYSKSGFCFYHD